MPVAIPVLSPKSHAKATRDPSGSREAEPSNVTVSPTNGAAGKMAKAATGGASTRIAREVELVR